MKVFKKADSDNNKKKKYEQDIIAIQRTLRTPGSFVFYESNKRQMAVTAGLYPKYPYCAASAHYPAGPSECHAAENTQRCIVDGLQGWAKGDPNEDDESGVDSGYRSRLWVEMARGPVKPDKLEAVNLRILASPAAKAPNFYLKPEKGVPVKWADQLAKIRGRKVYWHDPKFDEPFWDSKDLHKGTKSFVNPQPDDTEQMWSEAELIPEKTEFNFAIRYCNLSDIELNLLLTTLVGFAPTQEGKGLAPSADRAWVHKIGYARPFMGSAVIRINKQEDISFDNPYLEPEMSERTLSPGKVAEWQRENLGSDPNNAGQVFGEGFAHLSQLCRVMRFNGAYEADELQGRDEKVRVAYPLGQRIKEESIRWGTPEELEGYGASQPPATMEWFTEDNYSTPLPVPDPTEKQGLPAIVR